MDLKEYLTTLSKENLISLLMDLFDINKEVRIYLTEKQNALPVLSEQNEPISPVADTLFNSTPTLIIRLFVHVLLQPLLYSDFGM